MTTRETIPWFQGCECPAGTIVNSKKYKGMQLSQLYFCVTIIAPGLCMCVVYFPVKLRQQQIYTMKYTCML